MKIKICGITNAGGLQCAVNCGADYLGFVFYKPSPRCVSIEQAAKLSALVPGKVRKVGVFVDMAAEEVESIMNLCNLDIAQLHGHEDENYIRSLNVPEIWKHFAPENSDDVRRAIASPAALVLIDAKARELPGGTGCQANWTLAAEIAGERKIMLAGGIGRHNFEQAIEQVHPWGLDLSTSLEASPGIKDKNKVKDFFAAMATVSLNA